MNDQPTQTPGDTIDQRTDGLCSLCSGALQQWRLLNGTYVYRWCVLAPACSGEAPLPCAIDNTDFDGAAPQLPGTFFGVWPAFCASLPALPGIERI